MGEWFDRHPRWTFSLCVALLMLFGALLAHPAFADTKTVTWVNSTQNTDSTPIPVTGAGSLVRTTVEYGTCNATNTGIATKAGEIFVAAPATTLQLSLVVVQMYCLDAFHSNTFATTFVAGAAGNSARSNIVLSSVAPPTPGPPTGLVVTSQNLVAFGSQQSDEKQTVFPVGTVALNTVCDTSMSANGLYRVPKSAVSWAGSVRPKVVFAQCSAG
jgi:hypothetical protein